MGATASRGANLLGLRRSEEAKASTSRDGKHVAQTRGECTPRCCGCRIRQAGLAFGLKFDPAPLAAAPPCLSRLTVWHAN